MTRPAPLSSVRVVHPAPPWVFSLPWLVAVPDNRRTTSTEDGQHVLTRRYKLAMEAAALFAQRERTRLRVMTPITGALALTVRVWFPDRRRRDVGNLRKLLTDAMKGIWYVDDAQLWRETWERCGIERGGRLRVTLAPWAPLAEDATP